MKLYLYIQVLFFMLEINNVMAQGMEVTINNDSIFTVTNHFASFTFNKTRGDLSGIRYGQYDNILGGKGSAYLSGPDFSMRPSKFRIVRHDADVIEIAFFHRAANHFSYDLHYILTPNVAGIYCFLVQKHAAGDSAGNYGQTRWGLRADEAYFDYHLVRDSIQGPMPLMSDLEAGKKIQDWTYQLPNGDIYTKYNYADYIDERYVHGMAGIKSGIGLFVIQASHEYLNGGPTKQYQNVHSSPYLINMFNCSHFLSDIRKGDNIIQGNWTKLNGPFLLYLNQESSISMNWTDAKQQAAKEIRKWPYQWMKDSAYPLQRGSLMGSIKLNRKYPAINTIVILADTGHDWQAQSTGYIYSAHTDKKGRFFIPDIRAGVYQLYAFGDNRFDEYKQYPIEITVGNTTALNNINWIPQDFEKSLWQIGIADRTTKGFKYSDHKRVYGLFDSVPKDISFIIGTSNTNTDWYYAQTKIGHWDVLFNVSDKELDKKDSATLYIAIAGAARNPHLGVVMNGQSVGELTHLGNDASIYRSAVLGGYYQLKKIVFPVSFLRQGQNKLSFQLNQNISDDGGIMKKVIGGIMYDAIKLTVQ